MTTLLNMDPSLLAFSGYPSLRDIVSSVALTFFAFTTLVDEPATAVALVCILALGVGLDWWWKHIRDARPVLEGAT